MLDFAHALGFGGCGVVEEGIEGFGAGLAGGEGCGVRFFGGGLAEFAVGEDGGDEGQGVGVGEVGGGVGELVFDFEAFGAEGSFGIGGAGKEFFGEADVGEEELADEGGIRVGREGQVGGGSGVRRGRGVLLGPAAVAEVVAPAFAFLFEFELAEAAVALGALAFGVGDAAFVLAEAHVVDGVGALGGEGRGEEGQR